MSTLNRDFSTPQNAGFEYMETLQGTLTGVSTASAAIVDILQANVTASSTLYGDLAETLQGTLNGVSSASCELVETFKGTLLTESSTFGNMDAEVFTGSLVGQTTATLADSDVTSDVSATALAVGTLKGGLYPILEASATAVSTSSGYLAAPLRGNAQAVTTATADLVATFKGTALSQSTLFGAIDTPDFISGSLTGVSSSSANLVPALSGRLSGVTTLEGSMILSSAQDLAGSVLEVSTLAGDTFLSVSADLQGTLQAVGTSSGFLEEPSSVFTGLKNIKLVNVIRR